MIFGIKSDILGLPIFFTQLQLASHALKILIVWAYHIFNQWKYFDNDRERRLRTQHL